MAPDQQHAGFNVFFGPAIYVGATSIITAKPTPDNLLPLMALNPERDSIVKTHTGYTDKQPLAA